MVIVLASNLLTPTCKSLLLYIPVPFNVYFHAFSSVSQSRCFRSVILVFHLTASVSVKIVGTLIITTFSAGKHPIVLATAVLDDPTSSKYKSLSSSTEVTRGDSVM